MRVVWDLDGVLRDLNLELKNRFNVEYPKKWFWRNNGKGVYDYIREDFNILVNAPATEYIEIAQLFNPIEIWSSQPQEWLKYTSKWLAKYFRSYDLFVLSPKEKESKLRDGIILIEDYPLFKNYDNIILIDRPYNQNVKCKVRVKNKEELKKYLTKLNIL